MSRKIHSKVGSPSILAELRKEFASYIDRFELAGKKIIGKYPRLFFSAMLVLMLISGVLAFSVMRQSPAEAPPYSLHIKTGTASGAGSLLLAGSILKEVLELQNQINILLKQDSLSPDDTVLVKRAFKRLELIHSQLTLKK